MEAAEVASNSWGRLEVIQHGREIVRRQGETLLKLAAELGPDFHQAVLLVRACRGSVLTTGIGKAGLIAQKVAATLASTGSASHFLHPAEAMHGDLGRVRGDDLVVAFSFSGESVEVTRLLPSLAEFGTPVVAITGRPTSSLAQAATVVLNLGPIQESCPLGLAPSSSTTAMLALGDALALVVSQTRGFTTADFARFHPGGSLGRKLARVEDLMRPLTDCRVAVDQATVREVLVRASRPGRRSGAVLIVDDGGRLNGIFTDSDLARLLENNRDAELDGPIAAVMTRQPTVIAVGNLVGTAVELLARRKISELPVVDEQGCPVGLIDITDVVGDESAAANAANAPSPGESFPATVPFPNQTVRQLRR